jgi:hypothetical protein
VDPGRARSERARGRGGDGQGLVLHGDAFHGIRGDVGILCDYHRHPFAKVHDSLGREHRVVIAMELGRGHEGRDGARAFRQVSPGEHGDHSRESPGGAGVDPEDPGMGVRAAHHGHGEHAGQGEVVRVASGPAQEAVVLLAPDGGAHERPAGVQGSAQTRLGFRCASRCFASSGSA